MDMRLIIAIDDTDDYESPGTGEVLEDIADSLKERGWFMPEGVTRHQLPILPDIAYTSHNSSMAVAGASDAEVLRELTRHCREQLEERAVASADPGLCIVVPELVDRPERLQAFAERTLRQVVEKEDALALASSLEGVHLSEHGGAGTGVIGALAGAALRMGGANGRFKGFFQLDASRAWTVGDLLAHPRIDRVDEEGGTPLGLDEPVSVGERLKTALIDHRSVLMVRREPGGMLRTLTRQEMKRF